jgi:hypothetical protein
MSLAKPREAKPSQAKVLTGRRRLARNASRRPRLLAIPAFDCIAGLYKRHLNSNKGIHYANNFKVRVRALTDLLKNSAQLA